MPCLATGWAIAGGRRSPRRRRSPRSRRSACRRSACRRRSSRHAGLAAATHWRYNSYTYIYYIYIYIHNHDIDSEWFRTGRVQRDQNLRVQRICAGCKDQGFGRRTGSAQMDFFLQCLCETCILVQELCSVLPAFYVSTCLNQRPRLLLEGHWQKHRQCKQTLTTLCICGFVLYPDCANCIHAAPAEWPKNDKQ